LRFLGLRTNWLIVAMQFSPNVNLPNWVGRLTP